MMAKSRKFQAGKLQVGATGDFHTETSNEDGTTAAIAVLLSTTVSSVVITT
jgi:hypothetical protein